MRSSREQIRCWISFYLNDIRAVKPSFLRHLRQEDFELRRGFVLSPVIMSKSSKSPVEEHAKYNISPGGYEEKPRLSEHEKKANHIASEQKRRHAIREGFDRLTVMVPGLENQGRSECLVLRKTVEYIRTQLSENARLKREIGDLGGIVDRKFTPIKTPRC
ncbi:hypothetical protein K3495_g8250 [Podosphaera aphanis]|nr:hypothetical protein K3495_g8250 [Podosphaera aphanis]